MKPANIIISLLIALLTIAFWAIANQPEMEPLWPDTIQGFSFSPLRTHHDPTKDLYPSIAEIDDDLARLAGKTHAIRTYSVHSTLSKIPELARKHEINVTLGAWIDNDLEKNALEVEQLIKIADKNRRNVVRVMVGNEVLLRNDLSVEQLIKHLDHARAELGCLSAQLNPGISGQKIHN
ncbi:MAG: hypothetical protein KZQ70_15650 [gamma proteobacterium symbiont of Lucinoma myriamae]|nr:hypothetical protein [gamma proteobacterium symbiont of Lucinoma myriamae]